MRKIIIGMGCAAPLIGSYYIIPRYTLPFDFYDHYFIFIAIHLYNIFSKQKTKSILPGWLIKGFSIFILTTLISFLDNSSAFNFAFFKQFFGAIFSASSYYLVLKYANFNIFYLFNRYLYFAFLAAAFAVVEELFHLTGIHLRPVFTGALGLFRVGGLSGEPYNLSMALFPAMFFYLSNLTSGDNYSGQTRRAYLIKSLTIFIAFFLTFSSTGYIGLFIALFLVAIYRGYFNIRGYKILFSPVFFVTIFFVFDYLTSTNPNFNKKVSDGVWFLQGDDIKSNELNKVTTSSYALLSNYYITLEGFKEHPVAGIGLGNYEVLYNQKFDELFGLRFALTYGRANYNDANSMFLRLLAETGIIGIALFISFMIVFLIKRIYKKNDQLSFYLVVINHGVFILFLIRLLRCGNYLSDGMFFFILLYYYSSKAVRRSSQMNELHP